MRIDILTLFPEMFAPLQDSIMKRAIDSGLVEINIINFREFSENKHHKVDDTPYGGGAGMLIALPPLVRALRSIPKGYVVLPDPKGQTFNHQLALQLTTHDHLIFVCGHYEGIDARFYDECDLVVSLGDFIGTGGEIPVMAIVDAVVRLIPGVITDDSLTDESFSRGLLEYDQYTKPQEFEGKAVPEILISGDHAKIAAYRRCSSLLNTLKYRPDLLQNITLSDEDLAIIEQLKKDLQND